MDIEMLVDIFVVLMPLLYAALVAAYGVTFYARVPALEKLKGHLLIATIACHLLYIVLRTIAFDHPPVTTVFEIMTVLAACIAIAYAY
ncbi:MAG TPA: hypothetical protein VNL69_10685, partial [Bacteroidota bacterium]|nr:hypothetical protein [Bacteroidota bacterium]